MPACDDTGAAGAGHATQQVHAQASHGLGWQPTPDAATHPHNSTPCHARAGGCAGCAANASARAAGATRWRWRPLWWPSGTPQRPTSAACCRWVCLQVRVVCPPAGGSVCEGCVVCLRLGGVAQVPDFLSPRPCGPPGDLSSYCSVQTGVKPASQPASQPAMQAGLQRLVSRGPQVSAAQAQAGRLPPVHSFAFSYPAFAAAAQALPGAALLLRCLCAAGRPGSHQVQVASRRGAWVRSLH